MFSGIIGNALITPGGPPNIPTTGTLPAIAVDSRFGVTYDASNRVSQWTDFSGNNRHFAQSTDANKPLYFSNRLNGLPSVAFDGVSHYCDAVFTQPQPVHIFMVMYRENDLQTGSGAELASAAAANGYFNASNNTTTTYKYNRETTGRIGVAHDVLTQQMRGRIILKDVSIDASNNWEMRINGGTVATKAATNPTEAGNFRLGWTGTNVNAGHFNGHLLACIVYPAVLGSSDATLIRTFLINRFGIDTSGAAEGPTTAVQTAILATQASDLLGYWPMDDAYGALRDKSSLTIECNPYRVPARSLLNGPNLQYRVNGPGSGGGKAVRFDGNGYFTNKTQAGNQGYSGGGPFGDWCIIGFGKPSILEIDRHIYWLEEGAGAGFFGLGTGEFDPSQIAVAVKLDSTFIFNTDHHAGSWVVGQWTMIGFQRSGNNYQISINGGAWETIATSATTSVHANWRMTIGNFDLNFAYLGPWKGDIAHVALWNDDLTDGEVAAIYAASGL